MTMYVCCKQCPKIKFLDIFYYCKIIKLNNTVRGWENELLCIIQNFKRLMLWLLKIFKSSKNRIKILVKFNGILYKMQHL